MVKRDLDSMSVVNIDGTTGKVTYGKVGSKKISNSSSSNTTTPVSDKNLDWNKIKNIPFASETTDGVLSKEDYAKFSSGSGTGGLTPEMFRKLMILLDGHTRKVSDLSSFLSVVSNLSSGDTIDVNSPVDATTEAVVFDNVDVLLNLNNDITGANSANSGIMVNSGKVEFTGNGVLKGNTPYSKTNSTGIIVVKNDAEVVFNGSGIDTVVEDNTVDNGQFGITLTGSSPKVTVNDGSFNAGWYCITGNGSTTGDGAVIEINGGEFRSKVDYAIYHPHNGVLNINGGYIYGAAGAVSMNAGTLNITEGELTSDNTGDTGNWSDGTSGQGNACINFAAKYAPVTCNISGGKFVTANDDLFVVGSNNPVFITITGGKFNVRPNDEWIAEGYSCSQEKDDEGFFVVTQNS